MGCSAQNLFVLVAVVLTACRPSSQTGSAALKTGFRDNVSELQMTGMHVQSYGETHLEWELTAPFGEMFTRKNFMRAKNMQITLFENGKKSSSVSAAEGLMAAGSLPVEINAAGPSLPAMRLNPGDMYVDRDVVVVSTDGSKLTTDWAYYDKKKDLITSTAPVQIVRKDSITNGVGLEASADLTKVKIFNQTLVIPDKSQETGP